VVSVVGSMKERDYGSALGPVDWTLGLLLECG
jgi:hypothetical protein